MLSKYKIITGNEIKRKDFISKGFSVIDFGFDIPEILSQDVEDVSIYKLKDLRKELEARNIDHDHIIVEDTALFVDGAKFLPTEIKHHVKELIESPELHDRKAVWTVSMALLQHDNVYISKHSLEGTVQYPSVDAPEFQAVFCHDGIPFPFHPHKNLIHPRMNATKKLIQHIQENELKKLFKIHIDDIPTWEGQHQEEKKKISNMKRGG